MKQRELEQKLYLLQKRATTIAVASRESNTKVIQKMKQRE